MCLRWPVMDLILSTMQEVLGREVDIGLAEPQGPRKDRNKSGFFNREGRDRDGKKDGDFSSFKTRKDRKKPEEVAAAAPDADAKPAEATSPGSRAPIKLHGEGEAAIVRAPVARESIFGDAKPVTIKVRTACMGFYHVNPSVQCRFLQQPG